MQQWPYWPTFLRLALALALGFFVGIERERRRKEAGLRTFSFVAMLGAMGGLLGDTYAFLAVGVVGLLIVLLNVETIRTGEGAELTTSAAMLVTAFVGIMVGQGHRFVPVLIGIVTAALLAWKEPLAGFSRALSESEVRSAVLLAILAFVIYPVLPPGYVDPWNLIEPRDAWVTVILIAALGFLNYVLLKVYGERGLTITNFLGGLVNSTAAMAELSSRAALAPGDGSAAVVSRGVLLTTAAMVLRNSVILGFLAPAVLLAAWLPLLLMFAGSLALVRFTFAPADHEHAGDALTSTLRSPFSLTAALRFGVIFLALQVAGTLAERWLGDSGFYVISIVGGIVSSASAVASAAALAVSGTLSAPAAGLGAVLASLTSAAVNLPLVSRLVRNPKLTRDVALAIGTVGALTALGAILQLVFGVRS